jgi:hypothetical protein
MDRIPSVEKYVWALRQKATDCSRKMLQKHYRAPQHTLTAQQMSRKMGWSGKAANGPYGTFAGKLRRLLTRDDLEFQIEVLCTFAFLWAIYPDPSGWPVRNTAIGHQWVRSQLHATS